MRFADDTVLCSSRRERVERKLGEWRRAMEERGLKISRKKTEYLGCTEHQDAEIHLQGETVNRVKTFTYLGSILAEDGQLDTEVTQSAEWVEELEESVWSVVRQETERGDQWEGEKNSGKTCTDVQGRGMGVEEGTGKEIGGRRNENATVDVRSYKAGQDKNEIIRGTTKVGEITKNNPGKEVEVVWACDEKRGTLRRKESNGNESTGEKEERQT